MINFALGAADRNFRDRRRRLLRALTSHVLCPCLFVRSHHRRFVRPAAGTPSLHARHSQFVTSSCFFTPPGCRPFCTLSHPRPINRFQLVKESAGKSLSVHSEIISLAKYPFLARREGIKNPFPKEECLTSRVHRMATLLRSPQKAGGKAGGGGWGGGGRGRHFAPSWGMLIGEAEQVDSGPVLVHAQSGAQLPWACRRAPARSSLCLRRRPEPQPSNPPSRRAAKEDAPKPRAWFFTTEANGEKRRLGEADLARLLVVRRGGGSHAAQSLPPVSCHSRLAPRL